MSIKSIFLLANFRFVILYNGIFGIIYLTNRSETDRMTYMMNKEVKNNNALCPCVNYPRIDWICQEIFLYIPFDSAEPYRVAVEDAPDGASEPAANEVSISR